MWDLVIAAGVVTGVAILAFLGGLRVAYQWSRPAASILCASVLAALLVFLFRFHGTLLMASLLPFSGVIVLANWIPVGAAFLVGAMLGQSELPKWRRTFLSGLILVVAVYSVVCCFQGLIPLGPAGRPARSWSPQTRPSTCGPCCAALLLQHYGIAATEEEMVRLCLTSYRGSPALGIYRGLKLKTAGTAWDVQVVCCTVDQLLEMRGPFLLRTIVPPAIVLDGACKTKKKGATCQHAVLLMDAENPDRLEIRDPAVRDPQCYWRKEELRKRWKGEALRLVPRRHEDRQKGVSAIGLQLP